MAFKTGISLMFFVVVESWNSLSLLWLPTLVRSHQLSTILIDLNLLSCSWVWTRVFARAVPGFCQLSCTFFLVRPGLDNSTFVNSEQLLLSFDLEFSFYFKTTKHEWPSLYTGTSLQNTQHINRQVMSLRREGKHLNLQPLYFAASLLGALQRLNSKSTYFVFSASSSSCSLVSWVCSSCKVKARNFRSHLRILTKQIASCTKSVFKSFFFSYASQTNSQKCHAKLLSASHNFHHVTLLLVTQRHFWSVSRTTLRDYVTS